MARLPNPPTTFATPYSAEISAGEPATTFTRLMSSALPDPAPTRPNIPGAIGMAAPPVATRASAALSAPAVRHPVGRPPDSGAKFDDGRV